MLHVGRAVLLEELRHHTALLLRLLRKEPREEVQADAKEGRCKPGERRHGGRGGIDDRVHKEETGGKRDSCGDRDENQGHLG